MMETFPPCDDVQNPEEIARQLQVLRAALAQETLLRQRFEQEAAESKISFETLAENLPVSLYRQDLAGCFVYGNQRFCRLLGRSLGQIVGRTDFDFHPPERARKYRADDEWVMRNRRVFECVEEHLEEAGGNRSFVLILKAPVFNRLGGLTGTQGMLWDVTAHKQTEQALREQEELIRNVIDTVPHMIFLKDREGRYVLVNKAMADSFGRSVEEMTGALESELNPHAEQVEACQRDDREVLETLREKFIPEESGTDSHGRNFWLETIKRPLFLGRDRRQRHLLGVATDITARKEAQQQRDELHQQLLLASRQAGMAEVATGVLHNVGNALNSINVATEMIASRIRGSRAGLLSKASALLEAHADDLPGFLSGDPQGRNMPSFLGALATQLLKEQTEMGVDVQALKSHIEHIKEVVAMQQVYARVGGFREKVPVSRLVEDSLQLNHQALLRHRVKLERDYRIDPELEIERHKVLQILVNLINNAKASCKESEQQDSRICLRIRGGEANYVVVEVEDNGVGIPGENLTNIFSHGFSTRKDGHFFGWHHAANTAKELGGSIRVHSGGPGKGATFSLWLPLVTE